MRSLLLVRPDAASNLPAALAARPGAIVFDLGDLAAGDLAAGDLAAGDRAAARRAVKDLLVAAAGAEQRPWLCVRIAALATDLVEADLDAILEAAPDAVLAPGIVGASDIEHLGAKLAVGEAMAGRRPGSTGIIAVAGDSARGILALASLPTAGQRLVALAFDGAALGGTLDPAPVRAAQAALVLAAMATGVPALDLGRSDPGHLARDCAAARRNGFSARLARSPAEVATIKACFGR